MYDVKYPSKKRVERDGVLIHAEGDELTSDPEEAARQGYKIDDSQPRVAKERIERDGYLVVAEGDFIPGDADAGENAGDGSAAPAKKPATAVAKKPATTVAKKHRK